MVRMLLLIGVLVLEPVFPAYAAESASGTLRFFNRDIVTFHETYFGITPAGRAVQGAQRIRDALAKGGPGRVDLIKAPEGLMITVDGTYVFRILQGDLDAEDGQTFEEARVVVGKRLSEAVAAERESLQGRELIQATGLGAVGALILCLVVWGLRRIRLRVRHAIDRHLARRLRLGQDEHTAILRVIRQFGAVVFYLVVAIVLEEWLRFTFRLFPYSRPWSERLTGYVAGIVMDIAGAIADAVPGLLMITVIAALAQVGTRVLQTVARGLEAGRYRFGIDADVVRPARQLATAALWLFAIAMAYPYFPGSSSEAFKGLSVLVGLMLSIGASGLVGQAAGGFILTFSRTLREGDWVRVGEVEGAVLRIGLFATKVRTPLDEEVSIPNSVILTTTTRNFSRPASAEFSLLETSVTIGYNAPWRQVHALLRDAAMQTAGVEREPAPFVFQTSLSDFYVQYSLRVRIKDPLQRPAILNALHANIQDLFNEYGVQIMSPHYLSDPAAPVIVPKERWLDPPASA